MAKIAIFASVFFERINMNACNKLKIKILFSTIMLSSLCWTVNQGFAADRASGSVFHETYPLRLLGGGRENG
ncbi:MAG: hypothetical protein II659_09510, partial [Bacteroidales bacterium]|nr:hypothetical protein [Bacteroidales bacterium]